MAQYILLLCELVKTRGPEPLIDCSAVSAEADTLGGGEQDIDREGR
jgi:hypothetical protein